ncbi:hypothetical protein GTO27_11340, partial [Candidatus Bathyarchaeota archaeon]|nr:hypothetical protein [Candidatus Bathyarchaeota archaeon]
MKSMVAEAEEFRDRYRGKVTLLDAKGLLQFLEERDANWLRCEGQIKYCFLLYSADSTKEVAKGLLEAVRYAQMRRNQALAFIDIELAKLLESKPSLIRDPILSEYKHLLEKLARKAPHMLSEAEEQLVITKDKNGVNAWQLLQS